MKGMPLPFEFERKGVVALRQHAAAEVVVPCANKVVGIKKRKYTNNNNNNNNSEEPKSVLDNINSSPSPPTSTSTLSSSFTGGGGGQTVGLAAVSNVGVFETHHRHQPLEQSLNIAVDGGGGGETVGLAAVSNVGVFETHHRHQLLEPSPDTALDGGDQKCGEMEDWESVMSESGQEQSILRWIMGDVEDPSMGLNKMLHSGGTADGGGGGGFGVVDQGYVRFDSNNPISQIGSFYPQKTGLTSNPPLPPPAEMYGDHHHQNPQNPHQLLQQKPSSIKKMAAIDELGGHKQQQQQQQQSIIDQLFIVADTIHNPILAQAILARLNHQLSPIGKPFDRAAFYFKEALQLLLHSLVNNMNPQISPIGSPFSLIFKIGAYKSFSEISPFVHFANFTCNQALLENLDGFDQVHIVDFDLGYGDQWASLMQELALRSNTNGVSIKITAFASPTTHDHLELSLTRDSLVNFANEINVGFDFEIVNIDVLASASWSLPFHASNNEAIAVNLPIDAFSNYQIPFPLVLRFVKSLAPKIVVSVDRGCERTDLPFPNHLIHALQSYSNLLESLDAVNMNLDVLQKIERFLIQPSIEKILTGRYSFPEKTQHWRAQFLSVGFSPLTFSNFTESQAVCMIKRAPVRGFHIEKRQSSLVLCWQRRELVSASAWRC